MRGNMEDVQKRPSHKMKDPHRAQMTCSLAPVLTTKPRGTWKVNHNLLGDGNEMTAGL